MFLKRIFSRITLPLVTSLTYVFLYLPIAVLILFSFNSVKFPYRWASFTWRWYQELFQASEIWDALKNSLIVAGSSVSLSLLLGMFFVFYSLKNNIKAFTPLFYINLLIPEIVLAVGLLSFYSYFSVPLGLTTLIAGHTVIGLGYAIPILFTRLEQIDYSVIEASLDLGATLHQTFVKVVVPLLKPALAAAGLLVFIISLDDVIIAFFCTGASAQTLSLYILAMMRTNISPTINALSTIMLVGSSLLVLLFTSLKFKTRVF